MRAALPFNRAGDRFDVIFLRNVMLYFSQETRRTLLAGIHRLLAPDGILFLGVQRAAGRSVALDSDAGGGNVLLPKGSSEFLVHSFTASQCFRPHSPRRDRYTIPLFSANRGVRLTSRSSIFEEFRS